MKQIIDEIFETGMVMGKSGRMHKVHSGVNRQEGNFLYSIIESDPSIRQTPEIGCAYGLSSLHICLALQDRADAFHTIIDPFQYAQSDGAGVGNLERAGFKSFRLVETRSEFALPALLENNEGRFDFILVDGWHTFDHTLLDCFYATRLLRTEGVLAIDDVSFPAVKRVVDYLKNYPCYKECGSVVFESQSSIKRMAVKILGFPVKCGIRAGILAPGLYRKLSSEGVTSMVALKKVKEDARNWDWHVDVF